LTAHDALAARTEPEYGITSDSRAAPIRGALTVGAVLSSLAIIRNRHFGHSPYSCAAWRGPGRHL